VIFKQDIAKSAIKENSEIFAKRCVLFIAKIKLVNNQMVNVLNAVWKRNMEISVMPL